MENDALFFQNSLAEIENTIENQFSNGKLDYVINNELVDKIESDLDGWDYLFSIIIGLSGAFISTNKKFGKYLKEIHDAASGASGDYDFFQKLIGKFLHHEGDHIDAIEYPFKNRDGGNADPIFHRLLWGHDILSPDDDNPLKLMFDQKGVKGLLQAVRHLLADTCSQQGLPLPGSSFLDFQYKDDGKSKTSNYLISISKKLSEEAFGDKKHCEEIYSHLFTIRAQDVTGATAVKVFTTLYTKIRKMDDNLRKEEITFISYAVNFFAEAIIGSINQKGVPYINITAGNALALSFGKFCYYNYKDLKLINRDTERIILESEMLISESEFAGGLITTHNSVYGYLEEADKREENIDDLISFFEEDEI